MSGAASTTPVDAPLTLVASDLDRTLIYSSADTALPSAPVAPRVY